MSYGNLSSPQLLVRDLKIYHPQEMVAGRWTEWVDVSFQIRLKTWVPWKESHPESHFPVLFVLTAICDLTYALSNASLMDEVSLSPIEYGCVTVHCRCSDIRLIGDTCTIAPEKIRMWGSDAS